MFAGFVLYELFAYHTIYRSESPQGNGRIHVMQLCGIADCDLRVDATQGGSTEVIFQTDCETKPSISSTWIGSHVTLLVNDRLCGSITVSYDFATHGKSVDRKWGAPIM